MTMYTMPLKTVLEHAYGTSMDPNDYDQPYGEFEFDGVKYGKLPILPDPNIIGLGSYPIFDENYRAILNGKIVDQYFNREIGMETVDDWRLAIRRKMDQIMPLYNKLYETEKLQYGPLMTMEINSESLSELDGSESVEATTLTNTTNKNGARVVNSATPQNMLAGNGDYATSATDSNSTGSTEGDNAQSSTSNSNNINTSTNKVTGFQGVASDLVVRYRNSFINIDRMIIEDVEDCFMLLLSSGDNFTNNNYGRLLF